MAEITEVCPGFSETTAIGQVRNYPYSLSNWPRWLLSGYNNSYNTIAFRGFSAAVYMYVCFYL